jgi:hypothetical protein
MDLAKDVEDYPLERCGPSSDPDEQTAYVYGFRAVARRFVAAVRRLKAPDVEAEIGSIDLEPSSILDAHDLKAQLVAVIDLVRDLDEQSANNAKGDSQSEVGNVSPNDSVRAFISYSTKDKAIAGSVKRLLADYDIESFLAHNDINVSEEWKARILDELKICNVFVPLFSESFKASDWAPQEVGAIAIRQSVTIVPLQIDDTAPFGFVSHLQGKKILREGPDFDLVIKPIVPNFPRVILPAMVRHVENAHSFRSAEAAMRPLVDYFSALTDEELSSLVEASIQNGQVWDAKDCRDTYIPALLAAARPRVPLDRCEVLEYQIKNQEWHPKRK